MPNALALQRQRAYLTLAEERAVLAPFVHQARAGPLTPITPLQAAWDARLGHRVHPATVYQLVHRHGHRQRVPRPRHGAAAPEAQPACKKTVPPSSLPHSPIGWCCRSGLKNLYAYYLQSHIEAHIHIWDTTHEFIGFVPV
jgi:Winged helix-turn helix